MRQGRHVIVGLVLAVLGCTPGYRSPQTDTQTWRGDKTGHVYQDVGGGMVEDGTTGVLYPRVDQVWIRGERGHLMYLYEGLVEEPQQWGQ